MLKKSNEINSQKIHKYNMFITYKQYVNSVVLIVYWWPKVWNNTDFFNVFEITYQHIRIVSK